MSGIVIPSDHDYNVINNRLSRGSTARGSSTGLFHVGTTKVKTFKSFTLKVPLMFKIKNTWLISIFHTVKSVTPMVTGCLTTTKVAIFVVRD